MPQTFVHLIFKMDFPKSNFGLNNLGLNSRQAEKSATQICPFHNSRRHIEDSVDVLNC